MANTRVLLKKSSVASRIPTTGDLEYGEVAINYADGRLYYKDSSNNIKYFLESSQLSTASTLDDVTTNGNTTTNSITVGGLSIDSLYTLPTSDGTNGQVITTDGSGNLSFTSVAAGGNSASDLTITSDTFTGDDSTVNYTLSQVATGDDYVVVSLNGVVQDPSEYSVSGTTLTFSTAPALNDNVELRTFSRDSANISLRDYAKFVYTITTTESSLSGVDDNGVSLSYEVGYVDVYQNGIRLVGGDDYTATNGTSITFTDAVLSGDTVEVLSYGRAYINDPVYQFTSDTVVFSTTSQGAVDTFNSSTYDSAKYIVQAKITGEIHATEVLVMHDGTDVYTTEYGTMWSGAASLGTFTADLSGGNIRLLFTPANINTTVKFKRIVL